MKRLVLLVMLSACGGQGGIAGAYRGTLNESFPCLAGGPLLVDETYTISVSGSVATIQMKSCGVQLTGTVSGDAVTVTSPAVSGCTQTSTTGTQIVVTAVTGTVALEQGGSHVDAILNMTATVSNSSCTGGVSGMMFPTGS